MDPATKWLIRGACGSIIAIAGWEVFGTLYRDVLGPKLRQIEIDRAEKAVYDRRYRECIKEVERDLKDPKTRLSLQYEDFDTHIHNRRELCKVLAASGLGIDPQRL